MRAAVLAHEALVESGAHEHHLGLAAARLLELVHQAVGAVRLVAEMAIARTQQARSGACAYGDHAEIVETGGRTW